MAVLVGREPETALIEEALARARLGTSATLVLRGEPGIGKSRLLQLAQERSGAMQRLSARGVEFESAVPFAGLHELLRPVFGLIDGLPAPAARALRSSLGLGERFESDRLLIGAATLGLITACADHGPLLITIDDAQWLDRASAEAIAFTARRLLADPIAILVAVREGESSPLLEAGLPELPVLGLDGSALAELVTQATGRALDPQSLGRLLDATGGNPLALLELAGTEALTATPEGRPLPVSTSVERAYLRRIAGLDPGPRRALLLMAASGTGELGALAAAAERLGVEAADLEAAESVAGLVRLHLGTVEFVHPLARAAVYHAASVTERRAAHRALAAADPDPGGDRGAWHLAAAAEGHDEVAAAALEEAAARARSRTAHSAAVAALAEAARLSADPRERARRFFAAAENARLAGEAGRALALLKEVGVAAAGTSWAPGVEVLSAQIAAGRGDFQAAFAHAGAAADALEERDPDQAIRILAECALVAFGSEPMGSAEAAARRGLAILSRAGLGGPAEIFARVALGATAILSGLADEGPAQLRLAAAALGDQPELGDDPLLMQCAAITGLFLRESITGRGLLERALVGARERAPAAALPAVLFYLARDAATTDRWSTARASYEESIRLARETSQDTWLCASLAGLAWLDAQEGREAECRSHAAEAEALAGRHAMTVFTAWAGTAVGLLELGLGRAEAAALALTEVAGELEAKGLGDPDLSPAPDLVDALVRMGRPEAARGAAQAHLAGAEAKGQPFALARATRGLAQVAPEAQFAGLFEAALEFHARTPDSFERARTLLCFGERLRRSRRRTQARGRLADAVDVFNRLGAVPWARRGLTELGASAEVVGPRDVTARHRLTSQELQIGLALAEGLTTRAAAAKLFLSPKTVEYHLRNVYGKLGIRSREELKAALGGERGG